MRASALVIHATAVGLSGLSTLGTPLSAQGFGLPPASPATVVDAVNECTSLQISDGALPTKWVKDGWESAKITHDGKSPSKPIGMFRKNNVLAMVTVPKEGTPVCSIDALLRSEDDFAFVREKLTSEFGAGVSDTRKASTFFKGAGKIIRFAKATDKPDVATVAVVFSGTGQQ